jgi:hypothetical protein
MYRKQTSDPWIVAQVIRVRSLEREVKDLLASGGGPIPALRARMSELKTQLALLDLAVN